MRGVCRWAGCAARGGRQTGYCPAHVNIAKVCALAGCEVRIAAYNRTGYCGAHYHVGQGDTRDRWREWGSRKKQSDQPP